MLADNENTSPNVLFISVDQWPGPLMRVAGHDAIETPTLDQLAANGTYFPNAYSECPICIPARRTMMTGTSPKVHGDRVFQPGAPMPNLPLLAQCFRDAGYQAIAVGKTHVCPPRNRIGFDDVILSEEGRGHIGGPDDYDQYLTDNGYPGRGYLHGMSNNEYGWREWHLPEHCHATNWASEQMARAIKRRDPLRPAFWHLSYIYPHPPIVPLRDYFERYARREIDQPVFGDWATDFNELPTALQIVRNFWTQLPEAQLMDARRAFYAQCTHIDHQLRVVLGTLREEEILDDTIILFTSDHGDMLGDHGLYAKRYMYEWSARIPMILMGAGDNSNVGHHQVDDRLVGLQDVMPTLLDLAGLDVPETCTGRSMVNSPPREYLFCEAMEDIKATRMVTDGIHKFIWYPCGNHVQLFDLAKDPRECENLAEDPDFASIRQTLERMLMENLHGGDEAWVENGKLVGFPAQPVKPEPNRGLSGQRGYHQPPPPRTDPSIIVGTP